MIGFALMLAAAPPAPTASSPCRVRQTNCTDGVERVDAMIRNDKGLSELQSHIDSRLSVLAKRRTAASIKALQDDERQFHRALRQGLSLQPQDADADRRLIAEKLRARWRMVDRIDMDTAMMTGTWVSAAGEINLMISSVGHYRLEMNPADVDIKDRGWACEISAAGSRRGDDIVMSPSNGGTIRLTMHDGVLRVVPETGRAGSLCGGRGVLSATYFASSPEIRVPMPPPRY